MPLYDYQCTECGETTEVLQRAKDKPLEKCPKCGGLVVKCVSSPAIQFKGKGWYVTDYAKKGSASAAKDKAEAKPETKPEAKPEAGEAVKAKPEKPSA